MQAGIDEAGRGPVLGPMVMAGVICTSEQVTKLKALGVTDSKLLSEIKREELFEQVKEIVTDYHVVSLSPKDIDAKETRNISLNDLEAEANITILKKINAKKAVVDCPSTNPPAYKAQLQKELVGVELICEHKADLNYTEAAAASILAKVTRDREIEALKKEIGIDFGSGYPSDPKTKTFVTEHWNKYPELFRKTWKTYQNAVSKSSQKGLSDF